MPRRRSYSDAELAKQSCIRCDAPSTEQWRCCADGSWRTFCTPCDVGLNEVILRWMGLPDAEAQIAAYRARKGV